MERRGELTSEQIIGIVLAIIGFIIILAFATQLGTEDYSTDEICRLSVLSRATAAEAIPGVQQNIPLKCTTKKICLTATKEGECSQFVGEKDVVNIQLPAVKDQQSADQQAREIERVLAQSMYDCWNIMGQGKLDLFSSIKGEVGFKLKDSKCVVCSRVALASDISDPVLKKVDVDTYMAENVVPGTDKTYISSLSDGATETYTKVDESTFKQNSDVQIGGTSTNEMAFVFMQIKSKSFLDVMKTQAQVLGIVGGGAFVARPSTVLEAGRFVFSKTGLAVIGVAAAADAGVVAYTTLRNQEAVAGYCGPFVSKSDSEAQGCSLVQGIPYSVKDIDTLCGTIEGNI